MMIPIYQLPVPLSSTFQHRPLTDPTHFRLLRLTPGHFALRKDAPWLIEYEVVHVSLDAAPSFEAVSYVWGSSNKTHLVRLLPSNRTLAVTETLMQVLDHVKKSSTTGYLWIDQLCINQGDELERNRQVSMMGEIYTKAKRTLAWLGEPDADSTLVLGTLDILGDSSKDFAFRRTRKEAETQGKKDVTRLRVHLQQVLTGTCSARSTPRDAENDVDMGGDEESVDEEDVCDQCFEAAATDRVKATYRLMSRPWFNRCWIVQEVLLAREVYMMIGSSDNTTKPVSPRDFHRAVHANLQAPLCSQTLTKVEHSMDEAPGLRALTFLAYFWDSLGPSAGVAGLPVFSCVLDDLRDGLASGHFQASDPRDVVYAFLGLHYPQQRIAPHYAWPVEDVYVDAAVAVVEETGDLSIFGICDAFYRENTYNLPSWTPDWSRASIPRSLFGPGREPAAGFCAAGPVFKQHAGFGVAVPRSRGLVVMGTRIDRITAVHPQEYPRERPGYLIRSEAGGGESESASAARRDSQTPDYLELRKTAEELGSTAAWSPSAPSPVTVGRVLSLLMVKEREAFPDDYQYAWREREEILYYAAGRRIASGAGDALALVPAPAAVGDEVWLLRGCPAPVVLRQDAAAAAADGSMGGAGAYRLVGACFYESVMHGSLAHLLEGARSVQLI